MEELLDLIGESKECKMASYNSMNSFRSFFVRPSLIRYTFSSSHRISFGLNRTDHMAFLVLEHRFNKAIGSDVLVNAFLCGGHDFHLVL